MTAKEKLMQIILENPEFSEQILFLILEVKGIQPPAPSVLEPLLEVS